MVTSGTQNLSMGKVSYVLSSVPVLQFTVSVRHAIVYPGPVGHEATQTALTNCEASGMYPSECIMCYMEIW